MPHKRAKRSIREQQKTQRGVDNAPQKQSLMTEDVPKSVARVLNAATVRAQWHEKKRKADDGDGNAAGGAVNAKKRRRVKETGEADGAAKPTAAQGKAGKEDQAKGKASSGMQILPGESLAHFNRRVEDSMRPLVRSAMASSSATARQAKKAEIEAKLQAKQSKTKRAHQARSGSDGSASESDAPTVHTAPSRPTAPKEFARVSSSAPRRLNDVAQAPPSLKAPRIRSSANAGVDAKPKPKSKAESVLSLAQRAMMEVERERVIVRYRELKERRAKEAA